MKRLRLSLKPGFSFSERSPRKSDWRDDGVASERSEEKNGLLGEIHA